VFRTVGWDIPNLFYQFTAQPLDLLQAYFAQHGGPTPTTLQVQHPTTISQPQSHKAKASRGVKGYPDGWRQVLNHAKDIVRSSILLNEPFPGPRQARVTVNECFYEAHIAECEAGTILEPGMIFIADAASLLTTFLCTPAEQVSRGATG
jgi:hypothetical protein